MVALGKLFILYLFFTSTPVILAILKVFFTRWVKEKSKEQEKKLKEQQKLEAEARKKILLKDYNQNVKPLYEEGSNLFKSLLKSKKLKRDNILELKRLLDSSIGSYGEKYKKYTFKNDTHEIYVKMKSTKIDKYDWVKIIEYLRKCERGEIA